MISVSTAKKILNKGKQAYSDEQAKQILETLSMMAELQLQTEQYKQENE
ncbi:MAG: hypothetical protein K6D59_07375 [Bacteroidales bacterium]|nr:hypothetical protein [Bacteroidales bacterium]